MKNPFLFKCLSIVGVVLLLWLMLNQINHLGLERQGRQAEAQQSVEASQAERQTLIGPVIQSRCTEEWDAQVGEGSERKRMPMRRDFTLSAVPTQLGIDAQAALEPRYRGIFKVNTYAAKTKLNAQWSSLQELRARHTVAGSQLNCAAPVLMVSVNDARGIRRVQVKLNEQLAAALPGTGDQVHSRGLHVPLPASLSQPEQPVTAAIELDLIGTGELSIAPIAESTQVKLTADWPHPSFGGRFLPVQRDIRKDGFQAEWQISALATTAPSQFASGSPLCPPGATQGGCVETFSVSFVDPVNAYSLSDRAVKYGLLFVALTFVAVGLVEALRRLRVHPVQYLLVGCALSIFFLLLLSLSEHLPFSVSYALAATACVALLTTYARYLLQGWTAGWLFGAGASALYGCLYLLLQMEQTAMVIGSLMLFAVLALVMILTRRLDWYNLLGHDKPAGAAVRGVL
jgi:inner membrane protein